MPITDSAEDLYRSESVLRDRLEYAYAAARRLVFDVVQGPPDRAVLTPQQFAALEEFQLAEAELEALRDARRVRVEPPML